MHIANDQMVAMLPSQLVYWKSVATVIRTVDPI